MLNLGGGSLKVICNIFDPEQDREDDMGDKGTYSGINGAVVLAYADNLQETHDNQLQIVESLNLHKCKYSLASDMKIINILLGISVLYIIIQIYTFYIEHIHMYHLNTYTCTT